MKHGTKWMVVAVVAFLAVGGEAMAAGKKGSPKQQLSGVVNLNTGSAKELDLLPGVGEKAVKKIVEHRSKTPFARVEELVKVKGFGKKKMEKLKPYLSVSGPTTLKQVAAGSMVQGRTAPK